MLFLKRVILGLLALGFIFFGGSGTQSNGAFSQGVGFVGLVVGIIILYIFLKMAWRAMGCLPSLAIFSVIVIFILFAIGAFSNGIENLGKNVNAFLGSGPSVQKSEKTSNPMMVEEELIFEEEVVPAIDEDFPQINNEQAPKKAPQKQQGAISKLVNAFSGEEQAEEEPVFNPANLPAVYGYPKVINGDTIAINGRYLKLFGIDAPEANQTCADKQGRSYYCGKESAAWLNSWITNNEIECRIMKTDAKGNMIGICTLGQYDIGAALVNAGWAVADVDIYYSYEQQAQANKTGLWQGRFYRPADWRKIQSTKPKIKVIKPKSTKKGIFDI